MTLFAYLSSHRAPNLAAESEISFYETPRQQSKYEYGDEIEAICTQTQSDSNSTYET